MNNNLKNKLAMAAKRIGTLILLVVACAVSAWAQNAQLQIANLDKLADKASDTVEVNLDKKLLQLAAKFLNSNNPTEAKVKELLNGLEGVYVRVFEFDQPGEYAAGDVESLRSQLQGWSKIVGVRSRKQGENVDVHIKYSGDTILGLAIIAADPKTLTVVNIVGPVDLEKLSQLEGQFGIPSLNLDKSKIKIR
ncbi:MAG: DUF4252 domain-containing protein [Blastocatellia bacterium]